LSSVVLCCLGKKGPPNQYFCRKATKSFIPQANRPVKWPLLEPRYFWGKPVLTVVQLCCPLLSFVVLCCPLWCSCCPLLVVLCCLGKKALRTSTIAREPQKGPLRR
jgi:hypothetical protein